MSMPAGTRKAFAAEGAVFGVMSVLAALNARDARSTAARVVHGGVSVVCALAALYDVGGYLEATR